MTYVIDHASIKQYSINDPIQNNAGIYVEAMNHGWGLVARPAFIGGPSWGAISETGHGCGRFFSFPKETS
jgi:hypothetical protein